MESGWLAIILAVQCVAGGSLIGAFVGWNEKLHGVYINLTRSVRRRAVMEAQFDTSAIKRFAALDGSKPADLLARIQLPPEVKKACEGLDDAKCLAHYASRMHAKAGELALSLSHAQALRESLDEYHGVTLVLEDDAAPLLYPFWTSSLQQIATHSRRNGWDYLRLFYCSFTDVGEQTYKDWQARPHEQYQPSQMMYRMTGTLGMMFTPNGLLSVVQHTSDADTGKLHCPIGTDCVSDHMIPHLTRGRTSKAHFPPLISVRHFEDATGVRDRSDSTAAGRHERSNAQAMMSAVMYYQFLIAEEFYGVDVGRTLADLNLSTWSVWDRRSRQSAMSQKQKAKKEEGEKTLKEEREKNKELQKELERLQKENEIKSEQIESEQIKGEQIESEQIKGEQIKSEQIKGEQIKSEQIKGEQIKSEQIKSEQIKGEQIKSEQIKGEQIKSEQIKGEQITEDLKKQLEQKQRARQKVEESNKEFQAKIGDFSTSDIQSQAAELENGIESNRETEEKSV